jgi:hypothetical protein
MCSAAGLLAAGDAIVVFMRALCAVSQEELEAGSSSTAAAAAAVGGNGAAGGAGTGAGGRGVLSSPAGGKTTLGYAVMVYCC